MKLKVVKILIFIIVPFLFNKPFVSGQSAPGTITIKGVITEKETGDPIPFANVMPLHFPTTRNTTISDMNGLFSLTMSDTTTFLKISCVGYEPVLQPIRLLSNQYLNIKMQSSLKQLSEVTIKAKRKRYKNKNRPSVQLIDKVIEHKNQNRPENFNYLAYEKYQKTVFSFDNIKDQIKDSKLLEPFSFIFKNTDTTLVNGKTLIPVYIKESISDFYTRKTPATSKEIIKAENLIRFDEHINRRSVSASINYLYQDINIYNNNITLLTNQFLSPIASMAPSFYKYFIRDTLFIDGIKCIKLAFEPRNKIDMLFEGYLYITLDSTFAVKKTEMTVNKSINLNWVRNINMMQEYEKSNEAGWLLKSDEMGADFGITQESFGVYGQRTTLYNNYKINQRETDSLYSGASPIYLEGSEDRDANYWDNNRFRELRQSERNIFAIMDSLKRVPQFKRNVAIISTLSGGFIKTKYFEFGLYSTFYSYNPIEGSRFKMGGRTTTHFSKKITFEPYVAYGEKDQTFKYGAGLTYSLTNRTIFDFPVKTLKMSYQYDIKIPGQELLFTQDDNLLISIKRGTNDKMYYNRKFLIEHSNEFANHFSYNLSYEMSQKTPAGKLFFNVTDYNLHTNTTPDINVSQIGVTLRYAPHEKFFQGTVYRAPFVNKYPVFQLQYSNANKVFGSDYNYQDLRLNINKRFYLSVLGYTDVSTEFGKVFGTVPYLLLDIHRANQSYSYQPESYNLMNFLEFVSDQYASIYIDHCFNGFLLNKIPLMKKLMLREVFTFKALYGELSNSNNPAYNADLFRFPTNDSGIPLTYTLEKKPYMEIGFGVSNIFRVFRIDYIKRISYLNNPDISTSGIRVSYKFDF